MRRKAWARKAPNAHPPYRANTAGSRQTPAIELAFGVLAPAENAGVGALKNVVDVNGKVGNNRLLSLYARAILSQALLSG